MSAALSGSETSTWQKNTQRFTPTAFSPGVDGGGGVVSGHQGAYLLLQQLRPLLPQAQEALS